MSMKWDAEQDMREDVENHPELYAELADTDDE